MATLDTHIKRVFNFLENKENIKKFESKKSQFLTIDNNEICFLVEINR